MAKEGKKGFLAEFRDFVMRGNVIDMAVGVIIAGAFGKITTTLVNNVFMPFIGFITGGGADLTTKLNWEVIPAELDKAGEVIREAVNIEFGTLLGTVIDFVLIAFIVFVMIKVFAKTRELTEKALTRKKEEVVEEVAEAPAPTTEELLSDILVELKKQNTTEN
ncbi:MAG: large conductance mechanosensitive channel protein MscL [Clostridia bacterium]|nr:large conductance mechanosensitive channel protein MscL [Clostridia bacterium]